MKKAKLRSIRFEMVIAISLLSIAICAAYFAASMTLSKSAVNNSMVDSLSAITKQSAALISDRVNNQYEKLSSVATNDLFWSSHISESRLYSLLNRVQTDEGYLDLVYVNNEGTAYNGSGKTYPIGDNEGYHLGMAGNNSVTDPTPTGDGDKMVMTYSVPVFNSAGGVVGVLMQTSDGYELTNLILDITYQKTGYAFVVNKDGVTLANPNKSLVLTKDCVLENVKKDPSLKGLADLVNHMVAGESGVGNYTFQGVTKYAGYAPIKGTHWFMGLAAPQNEVFAAVDQLQWILLAAAVLLALLSAGVAFTIAGRIAKPILNMMQVAERFAVGDLNVDVDVRQNNEIGVLGKAIQTVSVNMSEVITNIRAASEQVAVGSRQIADSGLQLAQGSTEQASALEELSASVEQIASQTRMNAKHASEANVLADNTRGMAERGNEKMSDMLKAMEEIDQSSSDIYRIIKVIDDIAFQTNILALNAAVEAARAGQHGRGFAVVAEEVRNLAAKSASAAKETSELIENSSKSVAGGAKLARETAESLKTIGGEINRVVTLVHGISVASGEQSTGIEQINLGLQQISQVVQANSSTSQQSAAASKELTAQADTLHEQVAGFKLRGSVSETEMKPQEEAINPEVLKVLDDMKPQGKDPRSTPAAASKASPAPAKAVTPPKAASPAPAKAASSAPAKVANSAPAKPAAPAKSAAPAKGASPAPAKPAGNAPAPASARTTASAAFARPAKISLGEEDTFTAPMRPAKISLGEDDDVTPSATPSARPRKVSLSDSEFGKY